MTAVLTAAAIAAASAPIELRDYQRRDRREIHRAFRRSRAVLYVAFMGSGKTVLAARVIRDWLAAGEKILILVHRSTILRQTDAKLQAAGIPLESIGYIWRDHTRTNPAAPIQLASVDTLLRREAPAGITRIVIDEAHHAPAAKRSQGPRFEVNADGRVVDLNPTEVEGQLVLATDVPLVEVCEGTNPDGTPCGRKLSDSCDARRRRRLKPRPHLCRGCATRKMNAALTPGRRSEMTRKMHAAMTPEQRSARSRKAQASLTPEQRSERARKANAARQAALTPEQRSEAIRKGWRTRKQKEVSQ